MGNSSPAKLRGKCVALRALTGGDLEQLRSFVNDPEVMQFSNVFRPVTDVQQEDWWRGVMTSGHSIWFGIEDVRVDPARLVGTCCLVGVDWVARQGELRIRLGDRSVWGTGLGTEATEMLVTYAFEQMNLSRVWLRVYSSNPRAQRIYEKLGFVVEGRQRQAAFVGGTIVDVILMGLLRGELIPPRSAR